MCSDNHRIRYHIFSLLHMMPCRRALPKRAPSAMEVHTVLLEVSLFFATEILRSILQTVCIGIGMAMIP